jgi:hypothetical protein
MENLYIHAGPLTLSPQCLTQLSAFTMERSIKLIVIDTLAAFWRVEDENNAGGMTKAIKPLLNLARMSGACILLIHHNRKSEGSHGDEIRGSGALFALADIAMVMKRHEMDIQRKLVALSRYFEIPKELILDLTDEGYIALGDPSVVTRAARLQKVKELLTDEWQETQTIADRSELKVRAAHRLLASLTDSGEVVREGTGKKGCPYRYKKIMHAPSPSCKGAQKESTANCPDSSTCRSAHTEEGGEAGQEVITDVD